MVIESVNLECAAIHINVYTRPDFSKGGVLFSSISLYQINRKIKRPKKLFIRIGKNQKKIGIVFMIFLISLEFGLSPQTSTHFWTHVW